MGAGFEQIGATSVQGLDPALAPPPPFAEPLTPAELRALVQVGENDSDACERVLAQVARARGALDLAIGEGLAALGVGRRLIALGYSGLRDYAREVLDLEERTAQALARLSRELRTRPLLRAAVQGGEVRLRHAQTVLPLAVGDAEAAWVARARTETVRALEGAVRAARACGDSEEEWVRFRVRLGDEDRATVDEALAIAGRLMPGSSRAERFEAMAQEYLSEHSPEAGDDGAGQVRGAFGSDPAARQAALRERLERETERWSFLSQPRDVRAPDAGLRGPFAGGDRRSAAGDRLAARRLGRRVRLPRPRRSALGPVADRRVRVVRALLRGAARALGEGGRAARHWSAGSGRSPR